MLKNLELQTRRTQATEIIRLAGSTARVSFVQQDFQSQSKGVQDFVSQVDKRTEQYIREEFLKAFPNDTVMGEEGGGQLGNCTWIVDPIDGTSNFVRGVGLWCISAALVVNGQVVIGIIFDPMLDEMFTCHAGGGSTLNGASIRVSDTNSAAAATLGISFNFQNSKNPVSGVVEQLLSNNTSFRMLGAGALSLAHCAAGRTDGFWEAFMKPWDAAAGLALVSEAGGIVCDYGANSGFESGNAVLVSNEPLANYFSQIVQVPLSTGS